MFEEFKEVTVEQAQAIGQQLAGKTFIMRIAEADGIAFMRCYEGKLHFITPHTLACMSDTAIAAYKECDCEPLPVFELGPVQFDHNIPTHQVVGYFNMAIKLLKAKERVTNFFKRG